MAVAELSQQGIIARKPRSLLSDSINRLKKNKLAMASIIFLLLMVLAAFPFASLITSGDFAKQDLMANSALPQWAESTAIGRIVFSIIMPDNYENYVRYSDKFPLGADDLGRDLWTRTIYGARVSLMIAIVASSVSLVIGTIYGLISGYAGGAVDNVMMRVVDFLYGFPFIVVVILLQTYFKALAKRGAEGSVGQVMVNLNNSMGGMLFLFIAIGLINWLGMARVARGQALSIRKKEYVEAAKAVGAVDMRIIFRHVLPNILGPLIVLETLAIPGYIFTEAFLSFIGLGVNPPTPSWGIMISETAPAIRSYPNQLLPPAMALTFTTLAFNFLGDGLRDAFDPKMKE